MPLTILIGLAAARLTRLLVDDVILDRPREWVTTRADGKWLTLATCPWCLSFHATVIVGVAVWVTVGLAVPLLTLGAAWWTACAAYWAAQCLAAYSESH